MSLHTHQPANNATLAEPSTRSNSLTKRERRRHKVIPEPQREVIGKVRQARLSEEVIPRLYADYPHLSLSNAYHGDLSTFVSGIQADMIVTEAQSASAEAERLAADAYSQNGKLNEEGLVHIRYRLGRLENLLRRTIICINCEVVARLQEALLVEATKGLAEEVKANRRVLDVYELVYLTPPRPRNIAFTPTEHCILIKMRQNMDQSQLTLARYLIHVRGMLRDESLMQYGLRCSVGTAIKCFEAFASQTEASDFGGVLGKEGIKTAKLLIMRYDGLFPAEDHTGLPEVEEAIEAFQAL